MTDATRRGAGIAGAGVALGALRVTTKSYRDAWGRAPRGIDRRAVAAFDEDETTLAVAAARRAVIAGDVDATRLGLVIFATSGDATAAATVAEALGAHDARVVDVTGRATAGAAALATAFESVDAAGRDVLVVVADVPRAPPGSPDEAVEAAGAAAFVLRPGGAVRVRASASAARELPGAHVADLAARDLSARAAATDADAFGAPAAFLVAWGDARTAWARDAKPPTSMRAIVGDARAASPLIDLAVALASASAGAEGLLAVERDGQAVVLRLAVESALPPLTPRPDALAAAGTEVSYFDSLRHRGVFVDDLGVPDQPMGAYVSLPDFARSLPQRYRLVAQKCVACAKLAFPPRATCPSCGARDAEDVALSGRGRVYSFTIIAQGSGPSEFAAEQSMTGDYVSAIVELEEGPRVAARLADVAARAVDVGMPVEATLRRLYRQQGVDRYGFKFAPANDADRS